MPKEFTLEYWIDDGWYVGRILEVPGVFSQGETLEELKENIKDAYSLVMKEAEEEISLPVTKKQKIPIEV
ncbi:type II toxin-antitoxin system HicB family antitoxin [Candidatus Calescamantes bacterium]|nr:type II toxin-antitoxin system HicB family antitoxin [Candidatus Calescamantes bacterium]